MLVLLLGLTWCVASTVGYIPPWSPSCPQRTAITNACEFGELRVQLLKKKLMPKDCNHLVEITEFMHTPIVKINSTNTTDRFTVLMVDMGAEGRGPNTLLWMVTNVTVESLQKFYEIPPGDRLEGYNPPSLAQHTSHRTLIQLLVFRHHNVLRVPFGELWVKQTRNFSLSTLLSNTYPNLRLCGPVAGTQFWVYDPAFTPSAPPAPAPVPPGPVQPVYIPVVPVGQAPASHVLPNQPPHVTFSKRSSATVSQPLQLLFVPLVILAVMWL